jgi:hypothetical protein
MVFAALVFQKLTIPLHTYMDNFCTDYAQIGIKILEGRKAVKQD